MSSAVEQLFNNFNGSNIKGSTTLRDRILFVFFILIIYRAGTYIPLSGIDTSVVKDIFNNQNAGLLGVFDMFSGGALSRMSLFVLNIAPYISASIIMQLMVSLVPTLEELKKEGDVGRKKISAWTKYLTVFIAIFQGYGLAIGLESLTNSSGVLVVNNPGFEFRISTVISILAGTMFLMWLGEMITKKGVGNGISLIIFAGVVANLPSALSSLFQLGKTGSVSTMFILAIVAISVISVIVIVLVERGHRKVRIQYPRRVVGNRMSQEQTSFMPIKVNTAGVIPPIFASSLLLMPLTLAGFVGDNSPEWLQIVTSYLGRGQFGFLLMYSLFILFFTFFYTSIIFNSNEVADNLMKNGAIIPGHRPGKNTENYLDSVLAKLTMFGGLYLVIICLIPEILISKYSVPFYLGGTSLLIIVTVSLDTVSQIQNYMFTSQYQNLIKKNKGKNRFK